MTFEHALDLIKSIKRFHNISCFEAEACDVACAAIKEKMEFENTTPLTFDEFLNLRIRAENGEKIIVYCTPLNDWGKVFKYGIMFFGTYDYLSWDEIKYSYGDTWIAYKYKPKEE